MTTHTFKLNTAYIKGTIEATLPRLENHKILGFIFNLYRAYFKFAANQTTRHFNFLRNLINKEAANHE
ncbi:hypothetical protein [Lactiplantibacillus fabifermentans]|uniref:Uncharacterized protein n=1 Tax=Lactiplantibacillus fabifermentans T30PCM01 TaxID=1400520 RepID=W6T5C0_9LACO|nr:hypothetical protein [Lactiplantibacillus fabifermentans]ETY73202.1 hypothetical protein LFAB_13625 [Lactiplantibacillus fabifermentans T30PCM01]